MMPNIHTNKTVLDRYLSIPVPENVCQATYVWIDGTGEYVRCKTRTMNFIPKAPEGKRFIRSDVACGL
jgi:glutamine synthetase